NALRETDPGDVRVASVLLRHQVGAEAVPLRLVAHRPGICGDRIEVDEVRRGGNHAPLVEVDRRRDHLRVPVERSSKQHRSLLALQTSFVWEWRAMLTLPRISVQHAWSGGPFDRRV